MALIFGTKLTAEQRLEQATSKIMAHGKYDALMGLLMYGDVTVDETTPTACTDGKNERYGRAYLDKLTDPEVRFLRLHECVHKMRRDLHIYEYLYKRNPQKANEACDYVDNATLIDWDAGEKFIVMPQGGMYDPQFKGMDAKQVFDIICKPEPDEPDEPGEPGDGEPGDGEPGDGKPGDGKPGDGQGAGLDSHDWEAAGKLTAEERDEMAQEIDDALRQGGMYAGRTGTGGKRLIENLLDAKVRWEDALRDYLQQQLAGRDYSSWRKFHRRGIANDCYMPSGVTDTLGEVVIGADASGSIGSAFISQFLGEVKGICDTLQPEKIRLLYWDTSVCREEVYVAQDFDSIIRTTKPEGGGGTDPLCVKQHLEQNNIKPECVVMLTDGYVGSWGGEWPVPVLWCVLNNKSAAPTNGQVLHIDI